MAPPWRLSLGLAALAVASVGWAAPSARAAIQPIPISIGPNGEPANGPSGHPSISGDNRKARLVAFDSLATNLVPGDGNGVYDVFVWRRPGGQAGLELTQPARPAGALERVSVAGGGEANGPSSDPDLGGRASPERAPRCVVFQSQASNLAAGDGDGVSDIFLRDLQRPATTLVSTGVSAPATNPTVDGDCRKVAFEASGGVMVAERRRGAFASDRIGPGSNPDLGNDGEALVYQRGANVMFRNTDADRPRSRPAARGKNPKVSADDADSWGVVYEAGGGCQLKVIGKRRQQVPLTRGLPGACVLGGVTTFAPTRGLVLFAMASGNCFVLSFFNKKLAGGGTVDDLARGCGRPPPIADPAFSQRGNFAAFTSDAQGFPLGGGGLPTIFFQHVREGQPL